MGKKTAQDKKMQRLLVPLFIFVWWRRLHFFDYRYDPPKPARSTVVKVKGWRTALIDSPGRGRATHTFCFNRREEGK